MKGPTPTIAPTKQLKELRRERDELLQTLKERQERIEQLRIMVQELEKEVTTVRDWAGTEIHKAQTGRQIHGSPEDVALTLELEQKGTRRQEQAKCQAATAALTEPGIVYSEPSVTATGPAFDLAYKAQDNLERIDFLRARIKTSERARRKEVLYGTAAVILVMLGFISMLLQITILTPDGPTAKGAGFGILLPVCLGLLALRACYSNGKRWRNPELDREEIDERFGRALRQHMTYNPLDAA